MEARVVETSRVVGTHAAEQQGQLHRAREEQRERDLQGWGRLPGCGWEGKTEARARGRRHKERVKKAKMH